MIQTCFIILAVALSLLFSVFTAPICLTQTYTLCKYPLGHNHIDCVCVHDCEIFLAFLFVLPVSGADIDQGGDDRLATRRSFRVFLHRWLLPTWEVETCSAFHLVEIVIVQDIIDPSCVFMYVLVLFNSLGSNKKKKLAFLKFSSILSTNKRRKFC